MGPGRPDDRADTDGSTGPMDSTAAWERFAPARDDLGPEVEPDWRDLFDSGPDRPYGGPALLGVGPDPYDGGADPVDRGEARRGWRRIGLPLVLFGVFFLGATSVGGWITIIDVVRARSEGTPGTFELEDCRYQRPRRHYGAHHCTASFTGSGGKVEAPVRVVVEKSPEDGGTTRTGHLRGSKGWADDISLRSRVLLELFAFVVLLVVVVHAARSERNRRKSAPPRDPPGWP
jgi:hypothetical protein